MSHCPTCKKLMRRICRYCQPQEYIDMMRKAFTELSDSFSQSRQQHPSRSDMTWVGLTDEEIDECDWGQSERDHARAIEAKLKAKNFA